MAKVSPGRSLMKMVDWFLLPYNFQYPSDRFRARACIAYFLVFLFSRICLIPFFSGKPLLVATNANAILFSLGCLIFAKRGASLDVMVGIFLIMADLFVILDAVYLTSAMTLNLLSYSIVIVLAFLFCQHSKARIVVALVQAAGFLTLYLLAVKNPLPFTKEDPLLDIIFLWPAFIFMPISLFLVMKKRTLESFNQESDWNSRQSLLLEIADITSGMQHMLKAHMQVFDDHWKTYQSNRTASQVQKLEEEIANVVAITRCFHWLYKGFRRDDYEEADWDELVDQLKILLARKADKNAWSFISQPTGIRVRGALSTLMLLNYKLIARIFDSSQDTWTKHLSIAIQPGRLSSELLLSWPNGFEAPQPQQTILLHDVLLDTEMKEFIKSCNASVLLKQSPERCDLIVKGSWTVEDIRLKDTNNSPGNPLPDRLGIA